MRLTKREQMGVLDRALIGGVLLLVLLLLGVQVARARDGSGLRVVASAHRL